MKKLILPIILGLLLIAPIMAWSDPVKVNSPNGGEELSDEIIIHVSYDTYTFADYDDCCPTCNCTTNYLGPFENLEVEMYVIDDEGGEYYLGTNPGSFLSAAFRGWDTNEVYDGEYKVRAVLKLDGNPVAEDESDDWFTIDNDNPPPDSRRA